MQTCAGRRTELSMGWVDPWVGLGWVEIFQFLVVWVWLGPGPYCEGGCGFNPPRNVEKKIFGNVKKHAQRNASADALCVCTIVMPGKAIWRL